jgi:hypothetical protein
VVRVVQLNGPVVGKGQGRAIGQESKNTLTTWLQVNANNARQLLTENPEKKPQDPQAPSGWTDQGQWDQGQDQGGPWTGAVDQRR